MLKSLEKNGDFFIFSCSCGLPECGGWKLGIQVSHSEENIRWTNLKNGKTWCFSKQKIKDDLVDIRKELANYRQFFSQKDIKYVGIGYNW